MRLQLGGGCGAGTWCSGGHNVYHDVMGDPSQAGEMGPGNVLDRSWVLGQAGQCLLWLSLVAVPPDCGVLPCPLSVPVQTPALLSSLLLSWPRPHT